MKNFDDTPITFKAPPGVCTAVDSLAARRGVRRADILRAALSNYFDAAGEPLPVKVRRLMREAA